MVLGDLGKRITAAVRKMSSNPVFDEDVLNEMLKEIAMALMAVSAPDVCLCLPCQLQRCPWQECLHCV
jgi:signal recognition particle GTPase